MRPQRMVDGLKQRVLGTALPLKTRYILLFFSLYCLVRGPRGSYIRHGSSTFHVIELIVLDILVNVYEWNHINRTTETRIC